MFCLNQGLLCDSKSPLTPSDIFLAPPNSTRRLEPPLPLGCCEGSFAQGRRGQIPSGQETYGAWLSVASSVAGPGGKSKGVRGPGARGVRGALDRFEGFETWVHLVTF